MRLAVHQLIEKTVSLLGNSGGLPPVGIEANADKQSVLMYPLRMPYYSDRSKAVDQIADLLNMTPVNARTSTGVEVREAEKLDFIHGHNALFAIRALNDEIQEKPSNSRETSTGQLIEMMIYVSSRIRKTPNVKNLIKSVVIVDTGSYFQVSIRMEGKRSVLAVNSSKLLAGLPRYNESAQGPYERYSALTENGCPLIVTTFARTLQR